MPKSGTAMSDERYALAFDDDGATLGGVVLRLLRLGTDVLYAASPDEAFLLARQEAGRIHALLFPPSMGLGDLARVAECLESHPKGRSPTLVVIGSRPDDTARAQLRAAGAEWAVWKPADDSALRFAVSAALCLPRDAEHRDGPRIPTSLDASFKCGDRRDGAVVYTLATRGAFLETPRPLPEGTSLQVELCLPEKRISVEAQVRYATAAGQHRRPPWPGGMGIAFTALDPDAEALLRGYVEQRAECFIV